MITKQSLEHLKEQADIVTIISSYIELRRNGNSFSACCPFHNEKTPSFVVSPARNSYHCYGCGVGGDCISFVMEYEHLNFNQSVEKIAEMLNFTLEYDTKVPKKQSNLLENTTRFYQQQLANNTQILQYLKSRGISQANIESFQLGYAPAGFETIKFLNDTKQNKQEALEFGIIGRDNTREFARFRERVIFPIHSSSGKVVGFGGRTLDSNNPAKYINSPQSKIFNKSKLLYGYYFAKDSIFREKKVIVCEGYIDVIMLHQAGFKNAVATLGTALTNEHLPLLQKGDPEIILSYDGDKAGIAAALRASKILSAKSALGGVVIFEGGKDPADMVQSSAQNSQNTQNPNKQNVNAQNTNGIEELKRLFSKPIPFIEFVLTQIIATFDLTNPLSKQKALLESQAFLKTLTPLLQAEYVDFLAQQLKITPNLIKIHRASQSIQAQTQIYAQTQNDIAESVLIYTLLEHRDWLDTALEYIDSDALMYYKKEFELLLSGQNVQENENLRALWLNENIKSLETIEDFRAHLRILITQAYKRDLRAVPNLGLDSKQKLESLATIKQKISQLQKGELISYEKSFGTF